MISKEILNLKQFKNIINNKTHLILIYFYASWCHTCVKQEHIIENNLCNNNIIFYKVNIDNACELVTDLDITTVPLIHIYSNNNLKEVFSTNHNSLISIIKSKILI